MSTTNILTTDGDKSRPEHDKMPADAFEAGKAYDISLNGHALYSAEVTKFSGGCWATVRVVKPLDETLAADYPPGATFDIKVAQYEFA